MTRKLKTIIRGASRKGPEYITHENRLELAPFVLFDAGAMQREDRLCIDWHPHSGVATVTIPYDCNLHHADSGGNFGVIHDGGLQWMASGSGIWHREEYEPKSARIGIHQLWVLLPPGEEEADTRYFNLQPGDIPSSGNTRVMLGEYQQAESAADISQDVSYLDVELGAGDSWQFSPPPSQSRGFVFCREGSILVDGMEVGTEDFAQFEESEQTIEISSPTGGKFVVATAQPWPHRLVHEYGQMHTNRRSLDNSKVVIGQLRAELLEQLRATSHGGSP